MFQIKRINKNLPLPFYQTRGSSGMDLYASIPSKIKLHPGERVLVPNGIAIKLPLDYEAQVRPRSGLANKFGLTVLNSPGTIDSDYTNEISTILYNSSYDTFIITPETRISQLVIAPIKRIDWEEVEDLIETNRGGFGSTGEF